MTRVTVFTPTYNRANVLHRVYDSLKKQTYTDFAWLIVDDGSQDETKAVVDTFVKDSCFPIQYVYQENQGKHVATNHAVAMTETELFIIADSDDAFVPDSIEKLVAAWDSIPENEKEEFKGVTCRCFEHDTGNAIGTFPEHMFDSDDIEANFKLRLNFEKWMLFRTDVLREFPFPEEKGLKFFPETVLWNQIASKYKTRFLADALREYYRDQDNALTFVSTPRFRENVFLWEHFVNDLTAYFWYRPCDFLKSFVGLIRDNILLGKKVDEILLIPNRPWKKIICVILYPAGWILSFKYKKTIF